MSVEHDHSSSFWMLTPIDQFEHWGRNAWDVQHDDRSPSSLEFEPNDRRAHCGNWVLVESTVEAAICADGTHRMVHEDSYFPEHLATLHSYCGTPRRPTPTSHLCFFLHRYEAAVLADPSLEIVPNKLHIN